MRAKEKSNNGPFFFYYGQKNGKDRFNREILYESPVIVVKARV